MKKVLKIGIGSAVVTTLAVASIAIVEQQHSTKSNDSLLLAQNQVSAKVKENNNLDQESVQTPSKGMLASAIVLNPIFDNLVLTINTNTKGSYIVAKPEQGLPEGVASVYFDEKKTKRFTPIEAGSVKGIILYVSYKKGYTGPTEVTKSFRESDIILNPTFDQLFETHINKDGGTSLVLSNSLPEGIENVIVSGDAVGSNIGRDVLITIKYKNGYAGLETISKYIKGTLPLATQEDVDSGDDDATLEQETVNIDNVDQVYISADETSVDEDKVVAPHSKQKHGFSSVAFWIVIAMAITFVLGGLGFWRYKRKSRTK